MTAPGIDPGVLLSAARLVDELADRAAGESQAFAAGVRVGYSHGYGVGHAHGHAQAVADLDAAWAAAPRTGGPGRDELLARGHIARDLSRPPALPVRMWDGEEWAKAGVRDLPVTEHGRVQWRDAVTAGRVPAELAAALAAAEGSAA